MTNTFCHNKSEVGSTRAAQIFSTLGAIEFPTKTRKFLTSREWGKKRSREEEKEIKTLSELSFSRTPSLT